MRADRIAMVADGRVVEVGTHDELVAAGGRYASMFATWIDHGGGEGAAGGDGAAGTDGDTPARS
jgi:hypothetical protein